MRSHSHPAEQAGDIDEVDDRDAGSKLTKAAASLSC